MPFRATLVAAALLLATVAGQGALIGHSGAAATPEAQSCAPGACTPGPPGAAPATVLGHEVLPGGCAGGDLHVMRYIPGAAQEPLTATWCR